MEFLVIDILISLVGDRRMSHDLVFDKYLYSTTLNRIQITLFGNSAPPKNFDFEFQQSHSPLFPK